MLVGSSTILGVFASFVVVQNALAVGIPWFVYTFSLFHLQGREALGWDENEILPK